MHGVDAGNHNAKPDFFRVHAADFFVRTGSAAQLLRNQILKIDPSALKTSRVYVCNIVTDNIHSRLVILHSGNTGK